MCQCMFCQRSIPGAEPLWTAQVNFEVNEGTHQQPIEVLAVFQTLVLCNSFRDLTLEMLETGKHLRHAMTDRAEAKTDPCRQVPATIPLGGFSDVVLRVP